MNTVTITVTDSTFTPYIVKSARCHTVWYRIAGNPDTKKSAKYGQSFPCARIKEDEVVALDIIVSWIITADQDSAIAVLQFVSSSAPIARWRFLFMNLSYRSLLNTSQLEL
jgi:hypothetical protein